MVAAMDDNRLIGKGGDLPWGKGQKADLDHYAKIIAGQAVLVGSKTYNPGGIIHKNAAKIYVLTRRDLPTDSKTELVRSVEEILELARRHKRLFVLGGGSVYKLMLPHANEMRLTFIKGRFKGDTYFPQWKENDWRLVDRQDYKADQDNRYDYSFVRLKRR